MVTRFVKGVAVRSDGTGGRHMAAGCPIQRAPGTCAARAQHLATPNTTPFCAIAAADAGEVVKTSSIIPWCATMRLAAGARTACW